MSRRHTLILLASSLGPLLALPARAPAQQPPPVPSQRVTTDPREGWQNDTLENALGSVRWDAAQRGPLLVVNAANTRARSLSSSFPLFKDLRGEPPPQGWTVRQLGEHFARREFPVRTLTVLAPAEMVTLNPKPAPPNVFANLSPSEAFGLFMASLTPAQVKLVTGREGIGISDLDQRQRDLFLALLPPRSIVSRAEMKQYESSNGSTHLVENHTSDIPLTDAARMQARFKLQKKLQLSLNPAGQPNHYYSFDTRKAGDTFYRLSGQRIDEAEDTRRKRSAYGVELRQWRSNKRKPGQIAFDAPALHPSVSLEGAATVGDLIKRISAATRVELHADRRVARLPLWVRGQSARSGDVLEALCLAVTGAFRKVGTAYLLTHDVEGLAVSRARLHEWAVEGNAANWKPRQEVSERFSKPDVFDSIPDSAENPFPITDEIRKQRNAIDTGNSNLRIPLASLPAEFQSTVRDAAARISSDGGGGTVFDPNVVRASEQVSGYFVLPGIGEVAADNMTGGLVVSRRATASGSAAVTPPPTMPPVVLKPEKAASRALFVSADALAGDDAARQVTQAASRRGLNQLWVSLTPDDDAVKVLTRAVAAGKQAGIAVWASPRLLIAPRETSEEHRDRTLLGNTTVTPALSYFGAQPVAAAPGEGDQWRRVDSTEAAAGVKGWLSRVASGVPGLGGVSLRDWAAPGYAMPAPPDPSRQSWDQDYSRNDAARFGYTPEMRLAFLRKEGVDPLDLISPARYQIQNVSLTVPFFPDNDYAPVLANPVYGAPNTSVRVVDGEVQVMPQSLDGRDPGAAVAGALLREWDLFRAEKNAGLLSEVYTSLRGKLPKMPLILQRETPAPYNGFRWFGSWDKADDLKTPSTMDTSRGLYNVLTARRLSKTVLWPFAIETDATYARRRPSTLSPETSEQRAARWNGYRRSLNNLFGAVPSPPPPGPTNGSSTATTPVRMPTTPIRTPVKPAPTWDGFVLDLTGFGANEIPAALGELLAEKE